MDPLRFALLGLGAGAAYALVSQGLVLIYRGAGIVNFAQGAIGMAAAFFYFDLHDSHNVPLAGALAAALCIAAATGLAVHVLVMRPLGNASPLVRLMSTLALMVLLLTAIEHTQAGGIRTVQPFWPTSVVRILPNTPVGVDRLILFATAGTVTLALALAYRRTWFGLATSAVAENTRSAGTLGISPDVIAGLNWAIAAVLSGAGAIFIASLSGEFNPQSLTLLVIPGLAAALVGRFLSFPLAFAGAMALGIAESEMGRYITAAGWSESGPFLVIVLILIARGRPLPLRGDRADRAATLGSGAFPLPWTLGVATGAFVAVWLASTAWVGALTATALGAIVLLSLVVVAGYAGQISLAQYTLAGMGAWVAARLVASQGMPFELAALLGLLAAVLTGVTIGLASLRARGVNLAVATLGAGLVIEQVILLNPALTGGIAGTQVGNLNILGVHLDSVTHPQRYATFVIAVLALLMVGVANLRRSTSGRRLVAIRENERAAASLGVGVFGAKLYAFALSSAIAAVGGILAAFQYPYAVFTQYTVLASITAVMQAVVGGIGHIMGAIAGGVLTPGGAGQQLLNVIVSGGSSAFVLALLGALGALAVLIVKPEGLVSGAPWPFRLVSGGRSGRPPERPSSDGGGGRLTVVDRCRLEVRGLTVTFGGVRALDGASLTVQSGEVVGLIGPNGSGKTTLIDAVTGLAQVTSGSVILNGVDLTGASAVRCARTGIGRTFQTMELFPGMTVADNLRVAADRGRWWVYARDLLWPGKVPLSPTALAVAHALGLDDALGTMPENLPLGRRRLVAIARALAAPPSVVLLDEPAAGLGPEDTRDLGRLLRRLADEFRLAILVVEHDISLVTDVCDRAVVLDRGVVLASGEPQAVLTERTVIDAYLGASSADDADGPGIAARSSCGRSARGEEVLLHGAGLRAGYGSLAVIRDLDIEVRRGEIVALLGPNGAGKTTTLLTLAGALSPMRGEVRWQGHVLSDPLHRRVSRGLAFVTEERSVFTSLTTEANLRLGQGSPSAAVELFPELGPLLRRKAGLLSGGEQQMLSLARALAAQPTVLLIDELSLGLAPIVVDRLFQALLRSAAQGAGVILVEQYTQRALEIADRAYVLNRGDLILHGTSEELRADPDLLRRSYLGASPTVAHDVAPRIAPSRPTRSS